MRSTRFYEIITRLSYIAKLLERCLIKSRKIRDFVWSSLAILVKKRDLVANGREQIFNKRSRKSLQFLVICRDLLRSKIILNFGKILIVFLEGMKLVLDQGHIRSL